MLKEIVDKLVYVDLELDSDCWDKIGDAYIKVAISQIKAEMKKEIEKLKVTIQPDCNDAYYTGIEAAIKAIDKME